MELVAEKEKKKFKIGYAPYLSFKPEIEFYKINPDVTQKQLDEDFEKAAEEYFQLLNECVPFRIINLLFKKIRKE